MPAQPLDYQDPRHTTRAGGWLWPVLSVCAFVVACASWAAFAGPWGYNPVWARFFITIAFASGGLGVAFGLIELARPVPRRAAGLIWASLNAIVILLVLVYIDS